MIFLTRFVYFYCFVERNCHSNFAVNGQHFLIHDTQFKRRKIIFFYMAFTETWFAPTEAYLKAFFVQC